MKAYGLASVMGDHYAGQTFVADFQAQGVEYRPCPVSKSDLYEDALEPAINAGEIELPDIAKLQEQVLGLVWRGSKIDHQSGEHDDWINAAAGVVWRLRPQQAAQPRIRSLGDDVPVAGHWQPMQQWRRI